MERIILETCICGKKPIADGAYNRGEACTYGERIFADMTATDSEYIRRVEQLKHRFRLTRVYHEEKLVVPSYRHKKSPVKRIINNSFRTRNRVADYESSAGAEAAKI